MNIAQTEEDHDIVAKTCGCKDSKRKVTDSFVDSYHSLCRDRNKEHASKLWKAVTIVEYHLSWRNNFVISSNWSYSRNTISLKRA